MQSSVNWLWTAKGLMFGVVWYITRVATAALSWLWMSSSSRFPASPWLGTGASLFQKPEHIKDALGMVEELVENSGAAISKKMSVARGGMEGAVHKDMLDGLDW
jgi:hypothetical protein